MQQPLFEYFSEEGHHNFLEDVSITLIDKIDPSNPLQRENYWRSSLKTMTPCPAGTQCPEDVPLWTYFGRDVPDNNRTKTGRIRFLTCLSS